MEIKRVKISKKLFARLQPETPEEQENLRTIEEVLNELSEDSNLSFSTIFEERSGNNADSGM